jgi:hypothetical protein
MDSGLDAAHHSGMTVPDCAALHSGYELLQ